MGRYVCRVEEKDGMIHVYAAHITDGDQPLVNAIGISQADSNFLSFKPTGGWETAPPLIRLPRELAIEMANKIMEV